LPSGRALGAPAGQARSEVYAEKVVETNLDDDADLETAAWVKCELDKEYISQVVGYERDAAGGIVSLGAVVKEISMASDITAIQA
jgi:hypothetical protein